MSGLFGELDRTCYLNVSAVVAVASACSVPMLILNNISKSTIYYESSDLSSLDYQLLFEKGEHTPPQKVALREGRPDTRE